MPTDPSFVISDLSVYYQGLVVSGVVKEKEKVKAEFKEAQEKG